MPERTSNLPICRHCDGFAKVAVTTGQSTPEGRRETVTATCPVCRGTGYVLPARAYACTGA